MALFFVRCQMFRPVSRILWSKREAGSFAIANVAGVRGNVEWKILLTMPPLPRVFCKC